MNSLFDELTQQVEALHAQDLETLERLRAILGRLPLQARLDANVRPVPVVPADVLRQVVAEADRGKVRGVKGEVRERGKVRDVIRAAVDQVELKSFQTQDVSALCPLVARPTISQQLTNWALRGELNELGKKGAKKLFAKAAGWRGGSQGGSVPKEVEHPLPQPGSLGGARESATAPAAARPAVVSATDSMRGKQSARRLLIEQIAEEWGERQWLANTMIEELQKRAPHLVMAEEQKIAARSEMMDAYSAGRLKSLGSGAGRYYSTNRVRSVIGARMAVEEGSPE